MEQQQAGRGRVWRHFHAAQQFRSRDHARGDISRDLWRHRSFNSSSSNERTTGIHQNCSEHAHTDTVWFSL